MPLEPKLKDKRWEKKLETIILKRWAKDRVYKVPEKPTFSIDTPPPYPSGRPWHIGAAAHYSQIDMIARTARMQGNKVYFPLGIDRNGLPVELYTEKKHGIHLHDIPRQKFVSMCRYSLDELEAEMLGIMKSMGMSCDFENYYRTDSKEYRALTQATFIRLWKKKMIYEDTRPNNFDLDSGTAIADAEIVYEELPTKLVHVNFRMPELKKDLVIATTRPELICACRVVMVNPKDDRYKKYVGKKVQVPLFSREVEVIAHPYVKMEFGSGVVMMCSYGDYADVRIFRELGLEEIIAIDKKGRMTEAAGPYSGMEIAAARKKVIEDLEKAGLVVKTEQIMHRTPVSERSKRPIEIIPMKEYYLRQLDTVGDVRKISKEMRFHPEQHRQILENWFGSITLDWPISRRRYYGTEIPIWYCDACGKACLPEPGPYYQPWIEEPPFKSCPHCKKSDGFTGETRTFDTWMDSSISPLFVSKYQNDEKFFKSAFPVSIRPQGKDIIRTWLYYTLLRCYQLTGKPAFKHVWVTGYGVDEKGEKMSKSKGNVIDPIPILEKYGADAFRFWCAAESSLGSDFRCSEERIDISNKFLTKFWNVSRFISSFPQPEGKPKLSVLDEWIMSELDSLISKCAEGYSEFNFFTPATAIRDFIWNIFAPHYLEMAKTRAYGEDIKKSDMEAARYTLHKCLETVLLLMAPITPFISDYIYQDLYGLESIHNQKLPESGKAAKPAFSTEELIEANSVIWKAKKEKGLSLRSEVKVLTLPKNMKPIEEDLKRTHNAIKVVYGKEAKAEL